jgi:hypothetical protein
MEAVCSDIALDFTKGVFAETLQTIGFAIWTEQAGMAENTIE